MVEELSGESGEREDVMFSLRREESEWMVSGWLRRLFIRGGAGKASKLRPPARTPRLFGSWQVCGRSRTLSGVPFVYRRMSYGGGERGKGLASWVLTAPRPAAAAAAIHSIGREGSIIFSLLYHPVDGRPSSS